MGFDAITVACVDGVLATAETVDIVLVLTFPDEVSGPMSGSVQGASLARGTTARIIQTTDINAPETVAELSSSDLDVLFVCGWPQLLRGSALESAPRIVGMHPTLLPKHRGRAPIPWTILEQLTRTGVSFFEISSAEADAGVVLHQETFGVGPRVTATELYRDVTDAHRRGIGVIVDRLLTGSLRGFPQDERRASFWSRRVPRDGLIDWDAEASRIDRLIRALADPYPGAFTYRGDCVFRIWKADIRPEQHSIPPGTVMSSDGSDVDVACGRGVLHISDFTYECDCSHQAPARDEVLG